jgi:hypothetical protein
VSNAHGSQILPAKLTTVFTGLGGRKYAIIADGDQFNRNNFTAESHSEKAP